MSIFFSERIKLVGEEIMTLNIVDEGGTAETKQKNKEEVIAVCFNEQKLTPRKSFCDAV
jgi:hypothetical protein